MKNKLSVYIAGVLFLLVATTACTQKMRLEPAYDIQATGDVRPGQVVSTDDVGTKILKSFHRVYGDMPGAKWSKSANGFMVSFRNNNMNNIIYYKTNGNIEASLHYYLADQLVPSVRNLVQSVFPNYTLFHVVEVQKNDTTAFYVKVQDATTIKLVKVVGDQWELVETLVKR